MEKEERSKKRRREPPSVISQRAAVTALSELSGEKEADWWEMRHRGETVYSCQVRSGPWGVIVWPDKFNIYHGAKYSFQTQLWAYLIPPIHPRVPCYPSGCQCRARECSEREERLLGWEKITLVNVFIADHHSEAEILLNIHLSLNHSQTLS